MFEGFGSFKFDDFFFPTHCAIHTYCTNLTYPVRNTSASFRNAALIRMGNGNRSMRDGNFTIASHWSPTLTDLSPGITKLTITSSYFSQKLRPAICTCHSTCSLAPIFPAYNTVTSGGGEEPRYKAMYTWGRVTELSAVAVSISSSLLCWTAQESVCKSYLCRLPRELC